MIGLILLVLNLLAALFKSKSRLEAENAALRQQLVVLRRKVHGRVRLTRGDRIFFVQLYRWLPSILKVNNDRPPRYAGALASRWVSLLLRLAVSLNGRTPTDRRRATRLDPTHEAREPALGCTTHSR